MVLPPRAKPLSGASLALCIYVEHYPALCLSTVPIDTLRYADGEVKCEKGLLASAASKDNHVGSSMQEAFNQVLLRRLSLDLVRRQDVEAALGFHCSRTVCAWIASSLAECVFLVVADAATLEL